MGKRCRYHKEKRNGEIGSSVKVIFCESEVDVGKMIDCGRLVS